VITLELRESMHPAILTTSYIGWNRSPYV